MEGQQNAYTDPFGLIVYLDEEDCFNEVKANGRHYYNDFPMVIEKPAYIISLPQASPPERYYFRTIGWEISLLIRSQLLKNQWRANDCVMDPGDEYIKHLVEKGELVSIDPADGSGLV